MLKVLRSLATMICLCGLAASITLWIRSSLSISDAFALPLPGSGAIRMYNGHGIHSFTSPSTFHALSRTLVPGLPITWESVQVRPADDARIRSVTPDFQWLPNRIGWPCWLSVIFFAGALAALVSGSRLFRRRGPASVPSAPCTSSNVF